MRRAAKKLEKAAEAAAEKARQEQVTKSVPHPFLSFTRLENDELMIM